jgi:two-component system response regulator AtoC
LENVLTRAVVLSKGEVLEIPSLGEEIRIPPRNGAMQSLREVEAAHIGHVLKDVNWHQGRACEILKISRPTLRKKIRDYRLKKIYS